jgi:hypothetical protein
VTADAILDAGSATASVGGVDGELKALRDIAEELAALYRRMDELQRQVEAHQQR